ncbi:hypothetical protein HDU79_010260 [Rhizoclosmatium sp. JEL0117]|nr:hypothetical protein HDU79_010260 [Rhizoclosmatium sp. JEL0117]
MWGASQEQHGSSQPRLSNTLSIGPQSGSATPRRLSFDGRLMQFRSSSALNRPSVTPSTGSEAREMIQMAFQEDTMSLCEGTKLSTSTSMLRKASGQMEDESMQGLLNPASGHKARLRRFEGMDSQFGGDGGRFVDNRHYDFKFNVSVVGAKGTGKRTMVIKECETHDKDSFDEGRRTINWGHSVEFKDKTYILREKLVRVEYWIANTGEDLLSPTAKLLSGCAATLFEVNSRRSFLEVLKWLNEMNKNPNQGQSYKPIKVLIANCLDSRKLRAISKDEGKSFATKHNMFYHECSSNDRKTFKKVYHTILRLVMDPILDLAEDKIDGVKPDANIPAYAITNGFVRTRMEVSYAEKVRYSQAVEEMEKNDNLTEVVDWL